MILETKKKETLQKVHSPRWAPVEDKGTSKASGEAS